MTGRRGANHGELQPFPFSWLRAGEAAVVDKLARQASRVAVVAVAARQVPRGLSLQR